MTVVRGDGVSSRQGTMRVLSQHPVFVDAIETVVDLIQGRYEWFLGILTRLAFLILS